MVEYYTQLLKGDAGDCFRTCIGCLIEMRPEHIPNFMDTEDTWQAWDDARDWLLHRGYAMIILMYKPTDFFSMKKNLPNIDYMLIGKHPREGGDYHAVIACNDEIIHDPAWTPSKNLDPISDDGIYQVVILMKL